MAMTATAFHEAPTIETERLVLRGDRIDEAPRASAPRRLANGSQAGTNRSNNQWAGR
jgi:hypothetical protein